MATGKAKPGSRTAPMNVPRTPLLAPLLALLLGGVGCASLPSGEAGPVRAQGYRSAEDLVRIREYFGGQEDEGGRLYLRTDPDARAGYYWAVSRPELFPAGEESAEVLLEVQLPGDPVDRSFAWTVEPEEAAGRGAVWIGLTGAEDPGSGEEPIAWRLRSATPAGEPQARYQSFLWGDPPPDG